jgi:type IV pilus assembly protein PilM
MPVSSGIWGIDIGQCALKALRLEVIDGVVTATAFDYIEHPKILSQPDADPDQITREALEQFLSRNNIKGDQVAMSVPGQSGLARFVKLPPVEEKKIVDIVKFEAKQQIPFPLDEVVWDYQKISTGNVVDGFATDTEIGLFAMKRDMISRFLSHFAGVNVEVHFVQMAPLALCNYVNYDLLKIGGPGGLDAPEGAGKPGKKQCIVALDIGTDSSNLIITDGARIIWQRPIPLGGNHFTRALTKEMKLTFAKAEHLKRNAAKSPELPNILKALKPVLTDFVGEVQRSLGYFTNTHRDAQVTYMVGLGSAFRLPGLQKYLGDKLQLDIRKPAKFERLAGETVTAAPVFGENLLSFPVAYGLALQGLGVARLKTNLLPPEITFDRKVRAKKPWVVAAAAMLLVGVTALAFGYSVPYGALQAKSIQDQMEADKGTVDRAKKVNNEVDNTQKSVDQTKLDVQSIIAGQDERLNWIKLHEFIDKALPVPGDGGNMDKIGDKPDDRRVYWNSRDGVEATRKYRQRLAEGLDPKIKFDDATRAFLATIDVEGVYTRFTPDLKAFVERAKDEVKREVGLPQPEGMSDEDFKTPPDGPGWVVEVRGTTYFKPPQSNESEHTFILNTLVRNLYTLGKAKPDQPLSPAVLQLLGPGAKPDANDPFLGRVSHVFLYNVWRDSNPQPNSSLILNNPPLIDFLVPGQPGAAAAGPPGFGASGGPSSEMMGSMMGQGGTTTSATTSWTRLGTRGTGSGGTAGPSGMMPPGSSEDSASSMQRNAEVPSNLTPPGFGSSGISFGGFGSSTTGSGSNNPYKRDKSHTNKVNDKNRPPRFEFIVVFVWKEPTPSDKFITPAPEATPAPVQRPVTPPPTPSPSPAKDSDESSSSLRNFKTD